MIRWLIFLLSLSPSLVSLGQERHPEYKSHALAVDLSYRSLQISYGYRITELHYLNFGWGYGRKYLVSSENRVSLSPYFTAFYNNQGIDFLFYEFGGYFGRIDKIDSAISAFIAIYLKYKFISLGTIGVYGFSEDAALNEKFLWQPVNLRLSFYL